MKGKILTILLLTTCLFFSQASWAGRSKEWKITKDNFEEIKAKAEKGDAYYQAILGQCYILGEIFPLSDETRNKGYAWIRKAAKKNDPIALYYIARNLEEQKEFVEAQKYFIKISKKIQNMAKKGNPRAQYILGRMYDDYKGSLGEISSEARKWYAEKIRRLLLTHEE